MSPNPLKNINGEDNTMISAPGDAAADIDPTAPNNLPGLNYGCTVSRDERSRLVKHFSFLELQDLFFQHIQSKTLGRWREQSNRVQQNDSIEYSVVAPMTITHPISDPLQARCQYKRDVARDGGHFVISDDSLRAIDNIFEAAQRLAARWVVFKTPTSFRPTQQNRDRFRTFFEKTDQPEQLQFVWQPSGLWTPELSHALAAHSKILCSMPDWTQIPVNKFLYINIETIAFPERELINYLPKIPENTTTRIVFSGKNKVRQARKFALVQDLLGDL